MNRLNKILSGLPILIILVWVFCLLFLIDSPNYRSNYYYYNLADTILTAASLLHALFYWRFYKKIAKYCVRAVIAITMLQLSDGYIKQNFYYYLYFFIITTTIIESIRVNLGKDE